MPIYEYRCQTCGRRLELLQGVGRQSPEPPQCPHCGGTALTRVMSAPFVPRTGAKGAAANHLRGEKESKEEHPPGESCGNWPDNEDYIKLP